MIRPLGWENSYSYEELQRRTIENTRNQFVVKSNALIQRSRFNLSALEQKILMHLVSKIKPDDTGLDFYEFPFREFCDVCGVSLQGDMYSYLESTLGKLSDKGFWIYSEWDNNGEHYIGRSRVRWISTIKASDNSHTVSIKFHEDMLPYLFKLRDKYTQYQLRNILAMNSSYASALYELLKSYEYLGRPIDFSLEELKNELGADNVKSYGIYSNFRREVIERALNEINQYTDLEVEFLPVKTGRKVTRLLFAYRKKNKDALNQALLNQDRRFSHADESGNSQLPGQMSFYVEDN